MNKKIIITGGHATPALALLPLLKKKGWEIFWVGETKAVRGNSAKTLEAKTIPELGIQFFSVASAKLHRRFVFRSFLSFWKIGIGVLQSLWLLIKIKPSVVLGFGSYVSIPVIFAAWLLRVPIVLHEQTAASGLANRILGRFANFVAISFQTGKNYFPEGKTVLAGNLVRKEIFDIRKGKNKTPIIYITGGSRGSKAINEAVFEIIPELLSIARVYHQTGQVDFETAQEAKKKLRPKLSGRYATSEMYSLKEVESLYSRADLVISRSGANTVSELAVTGTPAILIPIPWSESNEQRRNAELLEKQGCGEILDQEKLNGKTLLAAVKKILSNLEKYRYNAKEARKLVPEDAPQKLLFLLEKARK